MRLFQLLAFICFVHLGVGLNKYVDSFEELNYPPVVALQKRSLSLETDHGEDWPDVDLHFRAYNRTFHLKLRCEYHTHPVMNAFMYKGQIIGDPSSYVHGTLLDGIFDGSILTGDGRTFIVEKTARYYDVYHRHHRPAHFHSFIYADEEITHKHFRRTKRETDFDGQHQQQHHEPIPSCGLTDEILHEMMEMMEKELEVVQWIADREQQHQTLRDRHSDLPNFQYINSDLISVFDRFSKNQKNVQIEGTCDLMDSME